MFATPENRQLSTITYSGTFSSLGPTAATAQTAQLWNGAAPTKLIELLGADVKANAACNYEWGIYTAQLANAIAGQASPYVVGGTARTAVMGREATALLGTTMGRFAVPADTTFQLRLPAPLIINASQGIVIVQVTVNNAFDVTWYWRER